MNKRILAVLLAFSLVFGGAWGVTAYAAANTSEKRVVTNQSELNKALKSKYCKNIVIKTPEKLDITIDHKDYGDKVLTINGSQLTLTNGGHFKSITINNAGTVTEEGENNVISVADRKVKVVVAECASVAAIDLRKGGRVDLTVDGNLTEVNVEKSTNLKLTGKTDTAVRVVNNASGTSVSCKIKTDIVANKEMSVNFSTKKAAGSTVEANADIDVKATKYVPLDNVTVNAEGVNVNIDTDAEIISVNVKEIAKVNITGDGKVTVNVDEKAAEAQIVSGILDTIAYIIGDGNKVDWPNPLDGSKNLFDFINGLH